MADLDSNGILAEPMQSGLEGICPKCLKWNALKLLRSSQSELQGELSTYRCKHCQAEIEFAESHPPDAI